VTKPKQMIFSRPVDNCPRLLVLDVVTNSTLTAFDPEFVALASALAVPPVTADKAVLKAFPDRALTMEAFVGR
jgi:hypothetical protein